ncbi:hypothetical protein HDU91_007098 [Kappamyces sp. JEL0680]|nr:hypothetical protein HDU91_007098 [Kappamyces sp. JEL0680]
MLDNSEAEEVGPFEAVCKSRTEIAIPLAPTLLTFDSRVLASRLTTEADLPSEDFGEFEGVELEMVEMALEPSEPGPVDLHRNPPFQEKTTENFANFASLSSDSEISIATKTVATSAVFPSPPPSAAPALEPPASESLPTTPSRDTTPRRTLTSGSSQRILDDLDEIHDETSLSIDSTFDDLPKIVPFMSFTPQYVELDLEEQQEQERRLERMVRSKARTPWWKSFLGCT